MTLTPLQAWGTIAGFSLGTVGYALGWPMWMIFTFSLGIPVGSLVVWMLTGPEILRRYRFLFVVYGLVAVPACYELWVTRVVGEPFAEFLNIQPGPGEANVFLQYDLPGQLSELYPTRVESFYARAAQIKMCLGISDEQRNQLPVCQQLGQLQKADIGRFFRAAVDTGNHGIENVLYDYAVFLVADGAPAKDVEAAVKKWRFNFPFSTRVDPRLTAATSQR